MSDDLSSPPAKKRSSTGSDEYLLNQVAQMVKKENVTFTEDELRRSLEHARQSATSEGREVTADLILESFFLLHPRQRKLAVDHSDEEEMKRFSDPDPGRDGAGPSSSGAGPSTSC